MMSHNGPEARIDCTLAELYAALGPANGTVAEYVVRKLGQAGHVVRQLDVADDQADAAPAELHTRTTSSKAKGKGRGKA